MKQVLPKSNLSQRIGGDVVYLNDTDRITIMKPGEDFLFKYSHRIDEYFSFARDGVSWQDNDATYEKVMGMIKAFLIRCIRNPDNYKQKLLVDEDGNPDLNQEYYEDFNPQISMKKLAEQGLITLPEGQVINKEYSTTPKLVLFQLILSHSGWLTPVSPQLPSEVESFPDERQGNAEVNDSGTVQGVQPTSE